MTAGLLPVRRGEHLVIDDIDGRKISSADAVRDWQGLVMSKENWSPKQPQLTIRGREERINVTPTRTRPAAIGEIQNRMTSSISSIIDSIT